MMSSSSSRKGWHILLVGGLDSSQDLDTIYQYYPDLETWILREEKLSTPKRIAAATLPVLQLNAAGAIKSVQDCQ